MPRFSRSALSFSNVTSALALFVALGGTSYAVSKPPKNSVGTAQLRDASVTAEKLAPGVAITGPRGPRGAEGPAGKDGANGAAGVRGPSDVWFARGGDVPLSAAANVRYVLARTTVPAGTYLISGQTYVSDFTHGGEIVTCSITAAGGEIAGQAGVVGNGAGSTRALPYSLFVTKTFATPTELAFDCRVDQALSPPPVAGQARIAAIQVDTVH